MNRHDELHGITVAYNALQLFSLIKDDISLRRMAISPSGQREEEFGFSTFLTLSKIFKIEEHISIDLTCAFIIIAAFCHDIYRFKKTDHPSAGAFIVHGIAQDLLSPILNPKYADMGFERFLPIIENCIIKHEGNEEALNVEEGIVMLADVIDNDEERIIEKSPVEILKNDPQPIEYFSCKNISHPITISKGAAKIDLNVKLKEDAGWHVVHKIMKVAKTSRLFPLMALHVESLKDKTKFDIPLS
jgi:metal-dependent HD superfamily phosphatase/phosphodiesterase